MENPDLHPMDRKPLNRLTSNLIGVMTSRTSPHMQTLILLPLREVGLHMHEIVIISVYFFNTSPPLFTFFLSPCAPAQVAPFGQFSSFMAQKTCFRVIYVLFVVQTKFFLYFPLFFRNFTSGWSMGWIWLI